MAHRPRKPVEPSPFKWPRDIVDSFVREQLDILNRKWNAKGGDVDKLKAVFEGYEAYNNDKYPDLGQVEAVQKAIRMTTRKVYGKQDADAHFNKHAYPYLHDKNFQPSADWRPAGGLPQALLYRVQQYRQEQRRYEVDLDRYHYDVARYEARRPRSPSPVPLQPLQSRGSSPSSDAKRQADAFLDALAEELLARP
ncbi:uncharacterized protein LY89DRAFT_719294 [Mollisia scopiformis]|uniref:Uncharacterized protein n=1 Tax=Mollisia scopiformis TaxID=149040 RepID=A0A194X8W6_MOLSC|nr:uncharacterized protein LY89DRAFT_719294 [Mollisia scopiformis]KUJ16613.1 hypothetical protein LY89DRAFT_719294 [Mollisia scopiformis]